MQEERLDGSYLITKGATEEEIINAINSELNRTVSIANSAADLSSIEKYNLQVFGTTHPDFDWLDRESDKFFIKKVGGKWKKFKNKK